MDKLALDSSARTFDKDGMLHVNKSHISKATVNPYYGSEIPGYVGLGLQPDRIYNLLRPAEELAKAANSFAGKPILSKHVPISAADLPTELIIGSIGSNVEFTGVYLDANLSFWQKDAIVAIDTDTINELSCAYYYDAVMQPGVFEGVKYDGYMTNINANHLALVEVGRAGSDVVVADAKPEMRMEAMKTSKLGKALIAALGLLSPKIAADSALPELVGQATVKSLNKAEVAKKVLAMDAAVDSKLLSEVIEVIVALDEAEDDPKPKEAMDEDEEDEKKKKVAEDEDEEDDDKMSKKDVKAAMDSLRAELLEAEEARRNVRSVVGEIAIGMDSAAKVYEFALDHLKIDHAGIKEPVALKALFKVASSKTTESKPRVAQDSSTADLFKQFPNAARIKQA